MWNIIGPSVERETFIPIAWNRFTGLFDNRTKSASLLMGQTEIPI